jgi:hypothetical protein
MTTKLQQLTDNAKRGAAVTIDTDTLRALVGLADYAANDLQNSTCGLREDKCESCDKARLNAAFLNEQV